MVIGFEIKGARRWIHVPGLSIQPSEFVKPAFAVVAAWLFAHGRTSERFPGAVVSIMLYLMVVGLLMMQPDFGMTFVVSVVWFGQFFLAGLPIILVAVLGAFGIVGLIGAYMFFPHVTSRINRFLDPAAGDNYQVTRSLEAFQNGGAVRHRPRSGQRQDDAARRPCRFHLRGGGRGIRAVLVPRPGRAVRLHRAFAASCG